MADARSFCLAPFACVLDRLERLVVVASRLQATAATTTAVRAQPRKQVNNDLHLIWARSLRQRFNRAKRTFALNCRNSADLLPNRLAATLFTFARLCFIVVHFWNFISAPTAVPSETMRHRLKPQPFGAARRGGHQVQGFCLAHASICRKPQMRKECTLEGHPAKDANENDRSTEMLVVVVIISV